MSKKNKKAIDFQEYLSKQLKDKDFKKYFDEYGKQLEIAYQILQLRKKRKMSQKSLAEKLGTNQSNVARMESGRQNFTTEMLQRVANALGRNLRIEFVK